MLSANYTLTTIHVHKCMYKDSNKDGIVSICATLACLTRYKENWTLHIYIHAKHSRACQCFGPDIIQTAIDLLVLWPFSMAWEMNHVFFSFLAVVVVVLLGIIFLIHTLLVFHK